MRDLSEIRVDIDKIDSEILALYEKRMELACDVAEYKISVGKPVYDKQRENEKLSKLESMAQEENQQGIRELYELIMSTSRKKQYKILSAHNMLPSIDFVPVDKIDFEGKNICYQGVEGAYAQLALKTFFTGNNYNEYNVASWREAMEHITSGKADFAVLPIENSSAGSVIENYDLLMEYDVTIVGEQILSINHALLGNKGAKLSDITSVYSHPQALMQCDGFLREHMSWDAIALENTAKAAKKIKEDMDMSQAAIGSVLNADIYGLDILLEGIQDNKNNQTRFIIVTKDKKYEKEASTISLIFEVENKIGSLYHILSHFIFNGLDMTRIESRPVKDRSWEYRFFVDFKGNLDEQGVINALNSIKAETSYFKLLGNY